MYSFIISGCGRYYWIMCYEMDRKKNYRPISLIPTLSKVFERLVCFVFGGLWNAEVSYPDTQFVYRKGLGTCDALLCVAHTLQSALEMGRRLEWFSSTSVSLLTGSTIRRISSSSTLWELGALCSLFWHHLFLLGHSRGRWLSEQTGERGVRSASGKCFGAAVVPHVHHGAFLYCWKQALRLCWQLNFGSCCAIPRWESSCYSVYESWSKQGLCVEWPVGNETVCEFIYSSYSFIEWNCMRVHAKFIPVNPIDSGWNCAERVCRSCYFFGGVWC